MISLELQKESLEIAAQFMLTLPPEKIAIIFSLVNESISQMSDINKLIEKVTKRSSETHLFDHSMLIQRAEQGLTGAIISTALPDQVSIGSEIVYSYLALALNSLTNHVSKLINTRAH